LYELELINNLPELLLGDDAKMTSEHEKKIICDFDDFEMGEDGTRNTSMVVGMIDSNQDGSKSPRVLKA
jgi:hypothetical protein